MQLKTMYNCMYIHVHLLGIIIAMPTVLQTVAYAIAGPQPSEYKYFYI